MLYNKVKCSNCVFNEHNISNEYKWIVYMHVFPNNKRYVGITHYKDLTQRWGVDGTNYIGQYVYSGISKYGWDNIEHIILLDNLTLAEAALLESCYISLYNSNHITYGYNKTCGGEFPLELVKTAYYLVVTPDNFFLCDNVRHIINTIKHYCYRLNAPHLKSFNSCISTHIKNNKFKEPLRKQGTRIKYIINADIYVVPLDKDEIKLFY